jgi:hypothetical protein
VVRAVTREGVATNAMKSGDEGRLDDDSHIIEESSESWERQAGPLSGRVSSTGRRSGRRSSRKRRRRWIPTTPTGSSRTSRTCPSAQEEKIRAREAELEHISTQAELGTRDGRAKRTREVVTERWQRKRKERTPDRTDPRERLSRTELAEVNREAARIAQRLRTDHSRAAVARVFARRVARGQAITEAVFETMDELKTAPRAICPSRTSRRTQARASVSSAMDTSPRT